MLASAENMADRDPSEHMVFISRGEGEGRIERKIRKAQINTERLAVMFVVSSEIIVFAVFARVWSKLRLRFITARCMLFLVFFKVSLLACLHNKFYVTA